MFDPMVQLWRRELWRRGWILFHHSGPSVSTVNPRESRVGRACTLQQIRNYYGTTVRCLSLALGRKRVPEGVSQHLRDLGPEFDTPRSHNTAHRYATICVGVPTVVQEWRVRVYRASHVNGSLRERRSAPVFLRLLRRLHPPGHFRNRVNQGSAAGNPVRYALLFARCAADIFGTTSLYRGDPRNEREGFNKYTLSFRTPSALGAFMLP